MTERITAVFDSYHQAEMAVNELRRLGLQDSHISLVGRHDESYPGYAEHHHDTGAGAGTGLLAGAGVGALFGLAAAFIPGVGPFVTAGFLAHTLGAAAGGAVAGAVVGGTSGLVAGALANAGLEEHEAHYYGERIEEGGVLVVVDVPENYISLAEVHDLLARCGGHTAAMAV